MSQVWALWTLGSKGQRSRSQCKDCAVGKIFSSAYLLPLYTYLHETSHAVSPWVEYGPYGLWGQKVKLKGQGHNARITEKGPWRITASPLHLSWSNFTCSLPMSRVWTLWTLGSKVKGQGHNARITENGFLRITASPLHLSLWNFTCSLPMSQVCALWNLGTKGQRSRLQCKDYWKRFLALVLNLKQNSMARRHALFLGRHALFDSAMPYCLAPCHQNVPLIKMFTC